MTFRLFFAGVLLVLGVNECAMADNNEESNAQKGREQMRLDKGIDINLYWKVADYLADLEMGGDTRTVFRILDFDIRPRNENLTMRITSSNSTISVDLSINRESGAAAATALTKATKKFRQQELVDQSNSWLRKISAEIDRLRAEKRAYDLNQGNFLTLENLRRIEKYVESHDPSPINIENFKQAETPSFHLEIGESLLIIDEKATKKRFRESHAIEDRNYSFQNQTREELNRVFKKILEEIGK